MAAETKERKEQRKKSKQQQQQDKVFIQIAKCTSKAAKSRALRLLLLLLERSLAAGAEPGGTPVAASVWAAFLLAKRSLHSNSKSGINSESGMEFKLQDTELGQSLDYKSTQTAFP